MLNTKGKIISSFAILTNIAVFPLSCISCSSKYADVVLSCLGDSLTYGSTSDGSRMKEPFPTILKKKMKFKRVDNLGVGGELLSRYKYPDYLTCIADRYTEIPRDASIICVLGGTNDSLNDSYMKIQECSQDPMKTTEGATQFLINKIKENFPGSFLFFMTPTKKTLKEPNKKGYYQREYNDVIISTCKKLDVPILDLYNLCDSIDDIAKGDGVHWSQNFVKKVITPTIINFIRSNYNQNKKRA